MEIISYANRLPWQVDAFFFLQILDRALVAVALVAITVLAYVGLHRLLSNRLQKILPQSDEPEFESRQGKGWKFPLKTHYLEGIHDEA